MTRPKRRAVENIERATLMKTYTWQPETRTVQVCDPEAGRLYTLPHLARHSPDGFNCGYGGSGPADLAFSMLADAVGMNAAQDLYQSFKWDVIATRRSYDRWSITDADILAWKDEVLAEMRRTLLEASD